MFGRKSRMSRRPTRGRRTPVGRRGPVPTPTRRTPDYKIQPESKRKPAKRVSPKMQAYLERMFKARKKSTPKSKPPVQGEIIKAATPKRGQQARRTPVRGQQARRVPNAQSAARRAAASNRRVMSRALAPKKRG